MKLKHDVLLIWLDQPPKVSKGTFNYVSRFWGNNVIYVCNNDFNQERIDTNWNDGDFGAAETILLSQYTNKYKKVEEIMFKYKFAINIVGGLQSNIFSLMKPYLVKNKSKLVVFSERPGVYGNLLKRVLKRCIIPFEQRFLRAKYREYVSAFLPLGRKGVQTFSAYGWRDEILFPFMYDPVETTIESNNVQCHSPIRLLYVGRFSRFTKGTDVLMLAIDRLKSSNWTLDLVGGYGDLRDITIKWAEKRKNIKFVGSWNSMEVCKNMKNYDICIIPSKFDGWNLLVNESIRANIGVICTNQAVSDEIISKSGAGVVIKANNSKLLAEAIEYALRNPQLVKQWKVNAKLFAPNISSETVGNYFMDILDYTFYQSNRKKPNCPWL